MTIRVEDQEVTVSLDDGRTASVPEDLAGVVLRWVDQIPLELSWSQGIATAAVLAGVGEARRATPMETGRRLPPTSQAAEGPRISIGALAEEPSQPLADILRYRRSTRTLGPLSLTALATVLVRSGRVRSWDTAPDGYQITHRPAPSAGARHPCDMVVAANEVEGLRQGWWTFDPVACELAVAQGPHPPLGDAMTKAMEVGQLQGRPGAVIFLVAHFDRTLSRYPAGGPLVWRDAGVLLGLLHLCASALELGSCIVGTCGVVIEQRHPELVTDIGAIALGRDMTA